MSKGGVTYCFSGICISGEACFLARKMFFDILKIIFLHIVNQVEAIDLQGNYGNIGFQSNIQHKKD